LAVSKQVQCRFNSTETTSNVLNELALSGEKCLKMILPYRHHFRQDSHGDNNEGSDLTARWDFSGALEQWLDTISDISNNSLNSLWKLNLGRLRKKSTAQV